jgi:transcriptional regulator with PAS, ATPase and Fis domain
LIAVHQHAPAYPHLLSDRELLVLRSLFQDVGYRRDRLLSRWHTLYGEYCGESRSLTELEFHRIFAAELDGTIAAMLAGDPALLSATLRLTGEILRDRKTPLPEVLVAIYAFEEVAVGALTKVEQLAPEASEALDKLVQYTTIIFADVYLRTHDHFVRAGGGRHRRAFPAAEVELRDSFRGIVGAGPLMNQLYTKIEAAGRTRGTVLIVGESGVGKELVAHALHESGSNPGASFVPLNCAALPRDLTESELFGYRRGAFSGARDTYLGLFRAADGGTLFLDDITEMSVELQAKLLRAIQERRVRPVGLTEEIPIDVRIIASTNQDPAEALKSGRLRHDLYYRLQANILRVPGVRERAGDIPSLVLHFLKFFNSKMVRQMGGIGAEAMAAMSSYSWPGNVREIGNTIESAFTFGRGPDIELRDLPPAIRLPTSIGSQSHNAPLPTYAEVERELFSRALRMAGGNRSDAARLLEVSRKKLYDKINKYRLG